MHTRNQYLNGQCSYNQYYDQFVTEQLKNAVSRNFTADKLAKAYDKDEYLNSIPLQEWDKLAYYCESSNMRKMYASCGEYVTNAVAVCTLKQAAKHVVYEFLKGESDGN